MAREVGSRRRPKLGATTNTVAAMALCALVALVAITQSQAPPPAIAEISPQANRQIKDAPDQQASKFGNGNGVGTESGTTTTTTSTTEPGEDGGPGHSPPTTTVPRKHKCVGDPPRQIEDPQAPPCVEFWEGDNGGATAKGVTRDTINVFIPNYDKTVNAGIEQLYESFFNHRFEFYGRHMKLIDGGSVSTGTPANDQAAAATVDEQYHAFISGASAPDDFYYYAALSRRGILSVNTEVQFTDEYMRGSHNIYQYFMGVDSQFANLGNWACNRLAGGNAVHAGPLLQGDHRVFGVILTKNWQDNPVTAQPLLDELNRCGEKPPVNLSYTFNASSFPNAQISAADATNAMAQMQSNHVTSVFCLCDPSEMGRIMSTATGQGFFPEWLIGSYVDIDNNLIVHGLINAPEQMTHAFGVSFQPRSVTIPSSPPVWAALEEDPSFKIGTGDKLAFAYKAYWAVFQIATGLQMAGPHLTPETFEAGLRRAHFPNPITSIMEGAAGFDDPLASHSMTKDGAEIWWDTNSQDPNGGAGQGAYCYVDGGKRYRLGGWPKGGDPFFHGACDTGAGI